MMYHRLLTFFGSALILGGLIGCSSTRPSHLYILASPQALKAGPKTDIAVSMDSVRIPKHLDRSLVVTQKTEQELAYSEFHRWAGPLEQNITAVIKENLGTLLGTNQITENRYKKNSSPVQLAITIQHLTGTLGGSATLKAKWTITIDDSEHTGHGIYSGALSDDSPATYVAVQSDLLVKLSEDIAKQLKAGK